jgi:very-short-patch-repair endonuclease
MLSLNADNIVKEYLAGDTVDSLALRNGVSVTPIRSILLKNGIKIRPSSAFRRIILPNADSIISEYASGVSEKSLAKSNSVSRDVIHRILVANGTPIRTMSAAMYARMARTSPEERSRVAAASHDAIRGTKRSKDELVRRANTRALCYERTVSIYEDIFAKMLQTRGAEFSRQSPIGPYNSDFSIGSVAVEIYGGGWHFYGRHLARAKKRLDYLLNAGWHVLIICVSSPVGILGPAADYAISFSQNSSSDPSTLREYRMIRGDGDELSRFRSDDDDLPVIFPRRNARDGETGRYFSVPK